MRVLSISIAESESRRTIYSVTVEGMAPAQLEVDETTDVRVWHRDELTQAFGKHRAALLNRLVADYHDGVRVDFPVDVPDD